MKLFSLLFLSLFLLVFISAPVLAGAGIFIPPKDQRTYFFEPNKYYEFEWEIHRSNTLSTFLAGDLRQYGTIIDPANGTGQRTVKWNFRLPNELSAGRHTIGLLVQESAPDGAMVGGRAAVNGEIVIISLYPGAYTDADFTINNIPQNSSNTAFVEVQSWSENTLENVYADIVVFDSNSSVVLTTSSKSISLQSREKVTLPVYLATNNLPSGMYSVQVTLHGIQEGVELKRTFRIGTKTVSVVDYQKDLVPGIINKYSFHFKSNWNERIPLISGVVTVGNVTGSTAPLAVEQFDTGMLTTYLDLSAYNESLNLTEEGTIDLYISEDLSSSWPITVDVTPIPVILEQPGFLASISPLMLLYFALAILVLVNVAVLFKRKGPPKQKVEQPPVHMPQQPTQQQQAQQPAQEGMNFGGPGQ